MHFSPKPIFPAYLYILMHRGNSTERNDKAYSEFDLTYFPHFFLFYIHEQKLDSFNYICQLDIHNSAPTFCEVFLKQSIYIEALWALISVRFLPAMQERWSRWHHWTGRHHKQLSTLLGSSYAFDSCNAQSTFGAVRMLACTWKPLCKENKSILQ